jgi:hypothetical protein
MLKADLPPLDADFVLDANWMLMHWMLMHWMQLEAY